MDIFTNILSAFGKIEGADKRKLSFRGVFREKRKRKIEVEAHLSGFFLPTRCLRCNKK